ncbi:hypothetical protein GCM10007415_13270 [Parapedobacter pyrenivorans]|uniref:SnoaL-like domain-containing protein n=2 Tax=Parapedobacter pyrenivorans TaxID=1305674 RepID=A0A917M772_9SPHI|nr:hypothetical protein GCM10007415_13270 [Parapedobacter pyrenivorans]
MGTATDRGLQFYQLKRNIMERFSFNTLQSGLRVSGGTQHLRRHFKGQAALFLIGLFFAACNANNPHEKSEAALQQEKDAVLATIEKETEAFFARDYDNWKSTYVQEDYAFQAWSNRDGTFDSSVGWENIDNTVGKYIHDNPEPVSSHPIVERKNITFKFYDENVAYLTWDQFNSDREGEVFFHSKEVRLMEKIDGVWKIVCVSAFWDFKNLISVDKLPDIRRMDKESRGKDKI